MIKLEIIKKKKIEVFSNSSFLFYENWKMRIHLFEKALHYSNLIMFVKKSSYRILCISVHV